MHTLIPERGLFPTLLCDPDCVRARRLAISLEEAGFRVHIVHDAERALECVKGSYFRVILVIADLSVQDCQGFLKSVHHASSQSWLFVANNRVDEALRRLVFRCGGDALVGLPIDVPALVVRLGIMQARARPSC